MMWVAWGLTLPDSDGAPRMSGQISQETLLSGTEAVQIPRAVTCVRLSEKVLSALSGCRALSGNVRLSEGCCQAEAGCQLASELEAVRHLPES